MNQEMGKVRFANMEKELEVERVVAEEKKEVGQKLERLWKKTK